MSKISIVKILLLASVGVAMIFLRLSSIAAIDVNVGNQAHIKNDVKTSAQTGNNQTNNGSITTGNAYSGTTVTNVVNTNNVKNCCGTPTPTPEPTKHPTPTPTPTTSVSPTPTPTQSSGPTPTPTPGSSDGGKQGGGGGGVGGPGASAGSPQKSQGQILGLSATSEQISIAQALLSIVRPEASNASPTRIIIPRLSINLPVVEAPVVNGFWKLSDTSASHGVGSANPGEKGNAVIFAHARDGLFGPLRTIVSGDTIYVLTGKRWLGYTAGAIKLVSPHDTAIIAPTSDETLTLFTCSGFLDQKRLVVTAKPVSL